MSPYDLSKARITYRNSKPCNYESTRIIKKTEARMQNSTSQGTTIRDKQKNPRFKQRQG